LQKQCHHAPAQKEFFVGTTSYITLSHNIIIKYSMSHDAHKNGIRSVRMANENTQPTFSNCVTLSMQLSAGLFTGKTAAKYSFI
jgi:hypothetical protein